MRRLIFLVFPTLFLIFVFIFSESALAQTDVERAGQQAEAQRRLEAQQRRLEEEREKHERVNRPLSANVSEDKPTPRIPAGNCLKVEHITIQGATLFRASKIEAIKGLFEGRCLMLADLNHLLELYTQLYTSKGYIAARAYLPEQDVKDGELEIIIVEGRLVDIEINGIPAQPKDIRAFFPGMKGALLNLRDIEQGLDQINRLPSRQASMQIRPGETTGDTVLEVKVKQETPWRASYQIDNLGSRSTGRYKSKISTSFDGLLGFHEAITLSYDRTMGHHPFYVSRQRPHGNKLQGRFSVPLGYWTLLFDSAYSNYKSIVEGQTADVNTSGNTVSASGTLSYLFARSQTSKSLLDLSLHYNKSENYILGSLLEAQSRALSKIKLSFSHSFQIFQGATSLLLDLHKGLDWFGAVKDSDLPATSPRAQFNKLSFSASYNKPFSFLGGNWSLNTTLSGQTSEDRLFGDEQLSLGGLSSVRGSESGLIFGNQGVLWRTELALKLGTERLGTKLNQALGTIEPYLAFDWGKVAAQPRYDIEGGSLSGVTLGLRSRQGQFLFDLAYADLINGPSRLEDEINESGVFYTTMSINF